MESRLFALIPTAWGVAGLVGSQSALTQLVWPQSSAELARQAIALRAPRARRAGDDWFGLRLTAPLAGYFAGKAVDFADAAVDLSGLPSFYARVLRALRSVGYGRTISYKQLARLAGRANAARAVGQAMAANPLPIILPCHRVIRSDGRLGGFSGGHGLSAKRRLLAMERLARPRGGSQMQLAQASAARTFGESFFSGNL